MTKKKIRRSKKLILSIKNQHVNALVFLAAQIPKLPKLQNNDALMKELNLTGGSDKPLESTTISTSTTTQTTYTTHSHSHTHLHHSHTHSHTPTALAGESKTEHGNSSTSSAIHTVPVVLGVLLLFGLVIVICGARCLGVDFRSLLWKTKTFISQASDPKVRQRSSLRSIWCEAFYGDRRRGSYSAADGGEGLMDNGGDVNLDLMFDGASSTNSWETDNWEGDADHWK